MSVCVYDFMNCGRRISVSIWLSPTTVFFLSICRFIFFSLLFLLLDHRASLLNFFGWFVWVFFCCLLFARAIVCNWWNSGVDVTMRPLSILRHVKYLSGDFVRGNCIPIHLSHTCIKTMHNGRVLKMPNLLIKLWQWLHFQLLRMAYCSTHNKDESTYRTCM